MLLGLEHHSNRICREWCVREVHPLVSFPGPQRDRIV